MYHACHDDYVSLTRLTLVLQRRLQQSQDSFSPGTQKPGEELFWGYFPGTQRPGEELFGGSFLGTQKHQQRGSLAPGTFSIHYS